MPRPDSWCERLTALLETTRTRLPVNMLAIVERLDEEHVVFTCANALGLAAYRVPTRDLPPWLLPGGLHSGEATAVDIHANPEGPIESRLLLTGFDDDIRESLGARQAFALPLEEVDSSAAAVIGIREAETVAADTVFAIASIGRDVARLLVGHESPEAQIERLRRLEQVDAHLPSLFRVLDIREIFERVSAITKDSLPHDVMVLGVFSEDRTHVDVYAQTSESRFPERNPSRWPPRQFDGWLYRIVDDIDAHPLERDPWRATAVRSSIRFAIRIDDRTLGALNFSSRSPAQYGSSDVSIGRHVADYVALAMSHHRLAEQARHAEELKARAAKSDLLDEVLASVTDAGALPEVFDRISNASQRVLTHDALVLTAVLAKGSQARVYASTTPKDAAFPDLVRAPSPPRDPEWESELLDDLRARQDPQSVEAAERGYVAALRVPIRLDGEYAAELSFFSMAASRFSASDVPAARRIADRITLSFSRERGKALARHADEATSRAGQLEMRVRALTEELNARSGYHRVIGDSPAWHQVLKQSTQVGTTETTVLLLGESGTGKEVVARFIHRASPRARGPFVAINCAALPEQLLEAELFGYERGAFTGAAQSKPGQLEQAAGGTLFLDEVAEMSPGAQAKFLRVLQEREFQRLGGTRVLKADTRIIAATNRNLEGAMERGQFREDLYYRLNVFAINLPPLRDRREDILALSKTFLADLGQTFGRPPAGISQEARSALLEYHWPGNVRELRNILERAAILCDGGLVLAEHLAFRPATSSTTAPPQSAPPPPPPVDGTGDVRAVERAMIEKALVEARFNKSKAAKRLGLTRGELYARLRRYGLE